MNEPTSQPRRPVLHYHCWRRRDEVSRGMRCVEVDRATNGCCAGCALSGPAPAKKSKKAKRAKP